VSGYGWPILVTLFVWWFSTGVVLFAVRSPRSSYRWSLWLATGLLALGVYGIAWSASLATVTGAYVAFLSALLIWAWPEITFLMGYITGPRRRPSPAGCSFGRHFVYATQAILYHELAILAAGLLILALTWGAENQIGTATYLVLWVMRLSAKLNVFLGVPNLAEQFLPRHLGHLKSYFRKAPMNVFFPVAVTAATLVLGVLVQTATAADASPFVVVGYTLVATILALAILEHWFLVLPLPDAALWTWALKAAERQRLQPGGDAHHCAATPGLIPATSTQRRQ
jgi:putative photosynthetic complex assembly protein 2